MDPEKLKKALAGFSGKRVAVVGDLVADEYLFGETARISREAPVLILRYVSRELAAGGAGNAAANLAALGARVVPICAIGDDEMGRELSRVLRDAGCDDRHLILEPGRSTTTKTRILAGGHHTTRQQVIRIDRGDQNSVRQETESAIMAALEKTLPDCDALIVSDYSHGVVSSAVVDWINTKAVGSGRVVAVDSRHRMLSFRGVTALTPNEEEVEFALGRPVGPEAEAVLGAAARIQRETGCRGVLITRGSRGMAIWEGTGASHLIPIWGGDEIADVTGAGDTVIATFTLALSAGATMLDAAQLANIAGGLVVMKRGTATVSASALSAAIETSAKA